MTDDIRKIKNRIIINDPKDDTNLEYDVPDNEIKEGSLVRLKSNGTQMRVKDIQGNTFSGYQNNGLNFIGRFNINDVELF